MLTDSFTVLQIRCKHKFRGEKFLRVCSKTEVKRVEEQPVTAAVEVVARVK